MLGKGRGKGQREQAGLNAGHRGLERGRVVGEAPCRQAWLERSSGGAGGGREPPTQGVLYLLQTLPK